MKKVIPLVVTTFLVTTMLSGCSSATDNSDSSKIETTTEATTETTTEETTSITYKQYSFKNINIMVPDTWYDMSSGSNKDYKTFASTECSLEMYFINGEDVEHNSFDSTFDYMVDSLSDFEPGALITVNKKVSMTNDDFFIGKVDYNAGGYDVSYHKYMVFLIDVNTLDYYYLFNL